MEDKIALQNAEFDAFDDLAESVRRLYLTPVVDDSYPEMRHYYERDLRRFLDACKANGR